MIPPLVYKRAMNASAAVARAAVPRLTRRMLSVPRMAVVQELNLTLPAVPATTTIPAAATTAATTEVQQLLKQQQAHCSVPGNPRPSWNFPPLPVPLEDENDFRYISSQSRNDMCKHEAVVRDKLIFREVGEALIDKLYKALKPMEMYNDTFLLSQTRNEESSDEELRLTLDLGETAPMRCLGPRSSTGHQHQQESQKFTIQIDVENRVMRYTSPGMNGHTYLYVFSKKTHGWVGQNDGHDFLGMLVRDLMKQCNGLPDL